MATQKNSVGEVQQAIKQGAITREYKADVQHIILALNSLRYHPPEQVGRWR